MILGNFRLYLLGALLAGLATPSIAAASDRQAGAVGAEPRPLASTDGENGGARHSRQVDLPFLLDSGSPDREPRARAPEGQSGPHPFREVHLQKAAWSSPEAQRSPRAAAQFARGERRLSHLPEFG